MSFWDSIGDWGGSAVNWIGDNADWIGPVAGIASNIWMNREKDKNRDNLADAWNQQEQQKWQQGKEQYDSYVDYLNNRYGGAGGGGGGGGARLQNAAQMAAGNKAIKRANKLYRKGRKQMAPYVQAGQATLPAMVANYARGSDLLGGLMQSIPTDAVQNAFVKAPDSSQTKASLPSWAKKKDDK